MACDPGQRATIHALLRSTQFGRASAPMIPQTVHTMRGPKDGAGTASG
jgi:hypothetical protein